MAEQFSPQPTEIMHAPAPQEELARASLFQRTREALGNVYDRIKHDKLKLALVGSILLSACGDSGRPDIAVGNPPEPTPSATSTDSPGEEEMEPPMEQEIPEFKPPTYFEYVKSRPESSLLNPSFGAGGWSEAVLYGRVEGKPEKKKIQVVGETYSLYTIPMVLEDDEGNEFRVNMFPGETDFVTVGKMKTKNMLLDPITDEANQPQIIPSYENFEKMIEVGDYLPFTITTGFFLEGIPSEVRDFYTIFDKLTQEYGANNRRIIKTLENGKGQNWNQNDVLWAWHISLPPALQR